MVAIISKPNLAVANPTHILMSGQRVLEKELQIVANNLANSRTSGFQGQIAMTQENIYKTKDHQRISYVKPLGQARDLTNGAIIMTGSSHDFGLTQKGHFFQVQTPQGVKYTRNGRFQMNNVGELVNAHGHQVLDSNGGIILIPLGTKNFTVSPSGTMSLDGQMIGQFGVVSFDDPQSMSLEGGSLLATDQFANPVLMPNLIQGGYEESNVSPIHASIQLLEITNRFQEEQKMIENYEQLLRDTMNAKANQN